MPNTIYFISGDLRDQQSLLAGLPYGADVHLLDQDMDGLSQIARVLAGRCEIDTLHLLSHGSAGSIQLGSMSLTSDNLEHYASLLRRIGVSMSARGEILLYGCNIAEGDKGQAFVQSLSSFTNTKIAASSTLLELHRLVETGSLMYGVEKLKARFWRLRIMLECLLALHFCLERWLLAHPTLL